MCRDEHVFDVYDDDRGGPEDCEVVEVALTRDQVVRYMRAPRGPQTTLEVLVPEPHEEPQVRLVVTLTRDQLRAIARAPAGSRVEISPAGQGRHSVRVRWRQWRGDAR